MTKSTRMGGQKKKYISPRSKRERSKKSSQNKSKDGKKAIDKRYFEYIKHNESLNFYDSSKK